MQLSLRPVLSQSEFERVHEASLDLLERVGTQYNTPRALHILEAHGCSVDYEKGRANLPGDLVGWALGKARREVQLGARDSGRDVFLAGRRSHYTTDSQGTRAKDYETGEVRPSTAEDLRRGLLFADALDELEIVNVMVAANDVPAHLRTLFHFSTAFAQTSKHVRTGVLHARQVPYLVEMVKAATGEEGFRPIFSAVDCTISPLMHDGPMTEACIELAKLDVPIMVYPMPLAGGNAPVTLAGSMLVHNVEFLSAFVLFQLVNPGTPIIYGLGMSQMDMQSGRYGGSADGHACRLALGEMARHYGLPINLTGLATASTDLDALYGYEATTTCLLAHLHGADEIYSMGLLGSAQILSLDKMVLDNHLARQIRMMASGFPLDEFHLQADLIEEVGIGGHFLDRPETRRLTREEYVPMWPRHGEDILAAAHEEARDILENHSPPGLPAGAEADLQNILAEADEDLAEE